MDKKKIKRISGIIGTVSILVLVGVAFGYHQHIDQRDTRRFEELCNQGDSLVKCEISNISKGNLIPSNRIKESFTLAIQHYTNALELKKNDIGRTAPIERRIRDISAIIDSCAIYDGIVRNIREMIDEERLASAAELEKKQNLMSENIKSIINNL